MKKSHRGAVIGLVAALSLPLGLPSLAEGQVAPADPQEQTVATAKAPMGSDAGVAQAEGNLRRVTAGFDAGADTKEDLGQAKIALADARLRAAQDRKVFTGLRQDLETIVTQRQALLAQINAGQRAGAASSRDITSAEEALAQARARLDLYAIVQARQTQFSEASARQKEGASSAEEMARVTASLQKAEQRFVENGADE